MSAALNDNNNDTQVKPGAQNATQRLDHPGHWTARAQDPSHDVTTAVGQDGPGRSAVPHRRS